MQDTMKCHFIGQEEWKTTKGVMKQQICSVKKKKIF